MRELKRTVITAGVMLVALLLAAGCATTKPSISTKNPVETQCKRACSIMADCATKSGIPYSHTQLMECTLECAGETHPVIRSIVINCTERTLLKSCNRDAMSSCIKGALKAKGITP